MQPTEGFSIQRRALDVEDYIDILRRHKGWIFGPFLLTLVVSVVGVYLWPDSYDSMAVIQIKPQQISPQLVPVISTQDILERISQLSNQVMSRSELSAMIKNMNLYPRERDRMANEDVLEIMRRAIDLRPTGLAMGGGGRSLPAFQVKFTYYNRFDATKVVSALVSKFLEQDLSTRSSNTYQAVEFMDEEYNQAKKRLDEADQKMTDFRLANPGKLPEQLNGNLALLTNLQSRQQSLNSQLSQAKNDKNSIENRIELYKTKIEQLKQETKVVQAQAPKMKSPKLQQAEQKVLTLTQQLSSMLQQFKAAHPNAKFVQGQLDLARRDVEAIQKEEALSAAEVKDEPVVSPVNLANQREVQGLELQIRDFENNIKSKASDIAGIEADIKLGAAQLNSLNDRIQSMPVGDAQWQDLAREQAMAKERFLAADARLNSAKTAQKVDDRKQGEKLDLLDPASLPVDPTDPNRPMVIGVGAGLGLVLGLVMAGAREMKDSSLKNLKDVRAYTQMAILGSVPLLENDFVVRRRRRIAWLGWTVACLTAVLVMAGSIVYYYTTR